jgi:hypothetical protein
LSPPTRGPHPRTTTPRTLDRAALQQGRQVRRFLALTGTQQGTDRLAAAVGAQVEFGGEAAAGATERLITAPFFAPAACWWAHRGAVDEVQTPVQVAARVGLGLHGGQEAVPDAAALPAPEAGVHTLPRPVPLWQIPPRRTGLQPPDDGVDHEPMVCGRSARLRALGRQEGANRSHCASLSSCRRIIHLGYDPFANTP